MNSCPNCNAIFRTPQGLGLHFHWGCPRGNRRKKAPHVSLKCSVCGVGVTRGGRRSEPSLCTAHYHRTLRGSKRAKDPNPGHAKKLPLEVRLARALKALAAVKRGSHWASFSDVLRTQIDQALEAK